MTTQKMSFNLNLRKLQEQIEDSGAQSKRWARRAALTYLGLLGLTYDAGKELITGSAKLLSEAEKRGEQIEGKFNRRWSSVEARMTGQVRSWREQVQNRSEAISNDLTERGKEIEGNARKFVARIKADGGVEPEIDEIKIAVEAAEKPPFEGYDLMTAHDVIGRLPEFSEEMLGAVRDYEAGHKNRVTVLREIAARLEPSLEAATEPVIKPAIKPIIEPIIESAG